MVKNICICGGGNLGHVIAGYLASKSSLYSVSILTSKPKLWSNRLEIKNPDNTSIFGDICKVTDDPQSIIPPADYIFICLPGPYIEKELKKITPYLSDFTKVGTIVSSTGFFFIAHELQIKNALFGFHRVPFISRIETYGHKAQLLGFKKNLTLCIENSKDPNSISEELQVMFNTPIIMANNFLEVSLSNSNPLLHPARLYTLWKDYDEKIFYDSNVLFYENWDNQASELYVALDDEFQTLLSLLPVDRKMIPPVLEYYESGNIDALTQKITSISAFKGIKAPMVRTRKGWIPDFSSRYFTEDFSYGMKYILTTSRNLNLDLSLIRKVYEWGNKRARTNE